MLKEKTRELKIKVNFVSHSNEPCKYSNEPKNCFIRNWFEEKIDAVEFSPTLLKGEIAKNLLLNDQKILYHDEEVSNDIGIFLVRIGKKY
jgi:hypothetical protein